MTSFSSLRLSAQARLLVLDEETTFVQSLSQVLKPAVPSLRIERCLSADHAQRLVTLSTYRAIVCSPNLTVADGWSLLTHSRQLQPPVPFLLTLRPDERECAEYWLGLGVYDFISSPLNPSQVFESVQDALVLSKRRGLIARKAQALIDLRHRQEQYQANHPDIPLHQQVNVLLKGSIARIEESTEALKCTVERIQKTLKALQHACQRNELHARERALNRLKAELFR